MRRVYTDVSDFRAPFDSPTPSFSGLGETLPALMPVPTPRHWPARRSYQDVSDFRAPYDNGYYQDNTLMGLGAAAPILPIAPDTLPEEFRRYVVSGSQMPSWRRDLGAASNQIPRWAWAVLSVACLASAYGGYKMWDAERKKHG